MKTTSERNEILHETRNKVLNEEELERRKTNYEGNRNTSTVKQK